jgi:hypothetical protein
MAKGLKGKIRGAGSASWVKGPDGKFNGSIAGGRVGRARERLGAAQRKLKARRVEAKEAVGLARKARDPDVRALHVKHALGRLRRAKRGVAIHQKDVARASAKVTARDRGPLKRAPEFQANRSAKAQSRLAAFKERIKAARSQERTLVKAADARYTAARPQGSLAAMRARNADTAHIKAGNKVDRLKRALKAHQREVKRLSRG